MRLFRIAKTHYINDLSGAGARANGGRWNRVGVGLLYTSPSRALATEMCPRGDVGALSDERLVR